MDIYKINNSEVIKCPHCNGTGICAKSVSRKNQSGNPYIRVCDYCGSGVEAEVYNKLVGGYYERFINSPEPPVCKVCNGTGFNRV